MAGDNVHQEILQEFTSYVASLSDEDKLGMIGIYPWFCGLIKTFIFEFGSAEQLSFECASTQERMKLFEKCPKVTIVIIRRKNPFCVHVKELYSRLFTAFATINQSLTQINLEIIPGPSKVPITDTIYEFDDLKLKYVEGVLQLDPTYDGTKFTSIRVNSMEKLKQKYPQLKLDRSTFPYDKITRLGIGISTNGTIDYHHNSFERLDRLDQYPILEAFYVEIFTWDNSSEYANPWFEEDFKLRQLEDDQKVEENVRKIVQDLLPHSLGKLKEFTFSEVKNNQRKDEYIIYRIFQVKGDLLIVSNRYHLPIDSLLKVFPNVSKVVLEVLEGQNGMTEEDVKKMVINIPILSGFDYQES